MIRVLLPTHLRTLAGVEDEVLLDVDGPVTQRSVLDALEAGYPMLRGTIRDQVTRQRRAFLRFFRLRAGIFPTSRRTPRCPTRWPAGRRRFWSWGRLRAGKDRHRQGPPSQ